ncbi:uncharacterized protein LOC111022121 [Momordica charantia]|uniref:Uncharacterized protein LOC111022121 n=1 Tax=Momordica charantia TaxID=3673 RepID=A0A6J1DQB2_MOMCH|nr:uncharacterized protein LOC111022121 [Momordica charantia]
MKDELLKAHFEVEILKAEVESQAELLKKEEDRRKAQLRAAHAITRGLEKEKFQLLKRRTTCSRRLKRRIRSWSMRLPSWRRRRSASAMESYWRNRLGNILTSMDLPKTFLTRASSSS